ncbi:MAG: multidrug effflux MFS transporter [Succinivibrionaceae bacterium]|nr:multidrug effflux MFS transporter [Succinivibrionaceae bacterium]
MQGPAGHGRPGGALFVFCLGMLTAFGPLCTDIYLPALPEVARGFGCEAALAQLSLTTSFLGLALGQLLVGPISDALGRRLPLFCSLAAFSLSSLMCALSGSVWSFIAWRLVQGLAGAGGIVLARAIACDLFRGSDLTRFMALLMTVNSVAPILGPILGSLIVTFLPWQAIFIFLCAFGALLIALSALTIPETAPLTHGRARVLPAVAGMFRELTNLRFLTLALAMSCVMGPFFGYLAASPFIFQSIYGFSELGYSLTFAGFTVLLSLLGLISGRLSHRVGDARLVRLSLSVMLLGALCMLAVALVVPASPVFVIIALALFIPFNGSTQSPGFGLVMGAVAGGMGAASGIFGVMHFITGALCSPLVGLMGDHSMIPLAVIMLAGAILALLFLKIGLGLRPRGRT